VAEAQSIEAKAKTGCAGQAENRWLRHLFPDRVRPPAILSSSSGSIDPNGIRSWGGLRCPGLDQNQGAEW